jgi:hypothetical protein
MEAIFGLCIALVVSLAALFFSFKDKYREYKADHTKPKSFLYQFIIGICGAIVTFAIGVTVTFDKKESAKQNQILSDSLFKMQNLIFKNLAGGGNLPELIFAPRSKQAKTYVYQMILSNPGNTPLRGLKVKVWNPYSLLKSISKNDSTGAVEGNTNKIEKDESYDAVSNNVFKKFDIGVLPVKGSDIFYFPEFPIEIDYFEIYIEISWDSGYIYCRLRGEKHDKPFHELKVVQTGDAYGEKKLPSIKVDNFMNK